MIQSGLLSEEDRKVLTALARDGSSPCRVTRRANALVLLDEGWNCQQVAHALLFDDDAIRGWRKLFEQRGIEGITSFDVGRFVRWARRGIWENLFRKLAGTGRSANTQMIDSTHVKAHRSAAGGKGGSRSRQLAAQEAGATQRSMHAQMLGAVFSPSS